MSALKETRAFFIVAVVRLILLTTINPFPDGLKESTILLLNKASKKKPVQESATEEIDICKPDPDTTVQVVLNFKRYIYDLRKQMVQ